MLRHQLPQLPPIDSMLEGVPASLQWIDTPVPIPAAALPRAPIPGDLESIAPAGIRYWGRGLGLEAIRFAGSNRLLIRFTYHGRDRLVEPYSLRQAGTGNILLYAWEVGGTHIKAFNTAEIRNARPTDQPFTPRYRIEFVSGGFAPILPSAIPQRHAAAPTRRLRTTTSPRTHRVGPTYVFRCPACSKEFRHTSNNATLRRHKAPGGRTCSGRRGYLDRVS